MIFTATELWRSDGTEAGTIMVGDINRAAFPSLHGTADARNGTMRLQVDGPRETGRGPGRRFRAESVVRTCRGAGRHGHPAADPAAEGGSLGRTSASSAVKARFTFTPCGGSRRERGPPVHAEAAVSAPDGAGRHAADPTQRPVPDDDAASPSGGAREVRFHYSDLVPARARQAGCSLLISTYQAGQLVAVGVADGQLTFSFRRFDHAMGVAVGADRLAVGGKGQVWSLRDHSELAPAIAPAGRYDRCWLPRSSTVTGAIQCHEIAWGTTPSGEPDLWIVNTLFSCLAGLDTAVQLRAALAPAVHLRASPPRTAATSTAWPCATGHRPSSP